MSVTKALNSKSNVKTFSTADYPVSPRQPVMARGSQESTINQTVITLPFSIDTVNAPDSLILSVDGKTLSRGSTFDYVYTAIDSFGFSNQVTLTQTIPAANLNIETIKLGLKKETEFGQDARFNNLYESLDQSSQGFVRTADLMVATTTTGTPASGTFYSSITNRASMPDLRTDLKVRMGLERIMVQQIYQLQNEFGPNGEPVFAAVNDSVGRIRFVGGWSATSDSSGPRVLSSLNITDYLEITFYGTGLNLLLPYFPLNNNAVYSVDGGSESANFLVSASSAILSRNYSPNTIINIISGLNLGVHTVKIRNNAATTYLPAFGFEILNPSSTLIVNSGSSYISGKKISTIAQQSLSHNSNFESGTLGTRGGRVTVYQKADGTIAKAVQPVNAAAAFLTSTDHTNEEVARVYHWREFGAGRADDFSLALPLSAAFTLDDGTTSLVGSNVTSVSEGLGLTTNGGFLTLTFVGTGLDIERTDDTAGGTDNYTYQIDGGTAATFATSGNTTKRITKIVSGLPYGTHTFRLNRVTAATFSPRIFKFIVYQPKKVTAPSGTVELADYNVMANYVANTTAGQDTIATGVLRKINQREFAYIGTWSSTLSVSDSVGGWQFNTATNGSYFEYVFFGTGFELRGLGNTTYSNNVSVTLNGLAATVANYSTLTSSAYGGFSFASGTLSCAVSNTIGSGFSISGLPLAKYTVRFQNNTATAFLPHAFDIITPIHSAKSNLNYDQQNTLPVGSNGISDNRKLSAIKELNNQTKNISQAVKLLTSTTTSTSFVPVADMSVTHTNKSGKIRIMHTGVYNGGVGAGHITIYVNGSPIKQGVAYSYLTPSLGINVAINTIENVPIGVNKIDVYYRTVAAGTVSAFGDAAASMILLVEEV